MLKLGFPQACVHGNNHSTILSNDVLTENTEIKHAYIHSNCEQISAHKRARKQR